MFQQARQVKPRPQPQVEAPRRPLQLFGKYIIRHRHQPVPEHHHIQVVKRNKLCRLSQCCQ